jgi:hypothetical protein
VADFVVELGALVVVVVVVVVAVGAAVEASADVPETVEPFEVEPTPEVVVVDAVEAFVVVEATVLSAEAFVPGISLDTMRPSAVVTPMARIVTTLDTLRTRARAASRRAVASGTRLSGGPGEPGPAGPLVGGALMVGMSPCEPLDPRTVG